MVALTVFLSCHPTAGGSGVVATELAAGLARRGHAPHIFSYGLPFRFARGAPKGVTLHSPPDVSYELFKDTKPHGLALAQSLACAADDDAPDILHAHYAFPFALVHEYAAGVLARRGPRPSTVVTLHGSDTTLLASDPCYKDIVRDALQTADAVTAVSKALAAESREIFGLEREIAVVPNFVDTEWFHPNRPPHPAVAAAREAGEAAVLVVSNFRPVKRVDVAVRAFAHIAAQRPARLLLAGQGPELAATMALAAELGLAERVVSLGLEVGIEGLYPGADLLLSPSDHESFGLAILEALACGVPVAATAVGGVPEVLGSEGGHARLAPAGDAAALGAAGLALLEGVDREAARERALLFTPERSLAGYEAVYTA